MNHINGISLIKLPNGYWHDKAFTNYTDADIEVRRLECEENVKFANIVTRFNKDNIPIGDSILVVSHYMKCIIDGKEEEQVFDTRESYFSIDELIDKSAALKDLKNDLNCDGSPVYYENIITAPEFFTVSGPYYRDFEDVGRITVLLYKLSVKRLNIVK